MLPQQPLLRAQVGWLGWLMKAAQLGLIERCNQVVMLRSSSVSTRQSTCPTCVQPPVRCLLRRHQYDHYTLVTHRCYPPLPQRVFSQPLPLQARLISRFHDLYLEPALRQLYPQVAPQARSSAIITAAGRTFLQHLHHLDKQLLVPGVTFAVCDTLTLADCAYPALFLYAQLLFPVLGLGDLEFKLLGMPRVAAWHAALCREAAVVKVLQELQPAAQEWLDSKLLSQQPSS